MKSALIFLVIANKLITLSIDIYNMLVDIKRNRIIVLDPCLILTKFMISKLNRII